MTRYIVQARCAGLGMVDCRKAETLEEARHLEADLKADADAWMSGDTKRETRIVPVEKSNCAAQYLYDNHK